MNKFRTRRGDTAAWTFDDLQIAARKRSQILNSMLVEERSDNSMSDLCTPASQFLLPMRRIEARDGI